MNRVICDICGTTYSESARQCPICGSTQYTVDEAALAAGEMELLMDSHRKGGRYAMTKEQKKRQDPSPWNAPQAQMSAQQWEQSRASRGNPWLIAFLVTLIFVMVVGTVVLYLRFYLPNKNVPDPNAKPPVIQEETQPTEQTEPTIPCTNLALLSGGTVELTQPGHKYLIHVATIPENTTDKVTFESQDESIATVSREGRVTAVAEGTTYIQVTCGSQSFQFKVVCNFSQGEDTP